jgi:hypothetical protein
MNLKRLIEEQRDSWRHPYTSRLRINMFDDPIKILLNVSELFSYKDSLFILPTTRKEDFRINSTFRFDSPSLYETSKGQQV